MHRLQSHQAGRLTLEGQNVSPWLHHPQPLLLLPLLMWGCKRCCCVL